MKPLIALLLSLFTLTAQAETITLEPAPCVNTLCNPVPNDAGRDIYVSYPIASDGVSRNILVSIDGVVYSYRVLAPNTGFSNVTLYSQLDGYIVASVEFEYSTSKACKACRVIQHYKLTGGTVVRP